MKESTVQVRIYKSDYKAVLKMAKVGDTTIARIIHEIIWPPYTPEGMEIIREKNKTLSD